MAWAALGGAYALKGSFLSIADLVRKGVEMERRAIDDRSRTSPTRTTGSGPALLTLGQVDEAIASIQRGDSPRSRRTARRTRPSAARYWVGKGDFAAAIPAFRAPIELNPEAGYSYLQLGAAAGVGGRVRRGRSASAAAPSSSRISTSPATPGCRSSAPTPGSATSTTCRAATRKRSASTSAGSRSSRRAITRSRSAPASRSRMKLGAAYHALGQGRRGGAVLRSRAEGVRGSASPRAPTIPYTRYYIACLLALRGETDRALEALERVPRRCRR